MKMLAFFLRFAAFVFFLLLSGGYYLNGLLVQGFVSSIVGGLCIAKADYYPYGIKAKAASICFGVVLILVIAP